MSFIDEADWAYEEHIHETRIEVIEKLSNMPNHVLLSVAIEIGKNLNTVFEKHIKPLADEKEFIFEVADAS